MSVNVYQPEQLPEGVLVVVAHPDDIDFGMAGTVASFTSRGVPVAYCLVTSGDAGGDNSTLTREERAAEREREQRAAAAVVGVSDLTFLGYPDGAVEVTLDLRRDISRVIRRVRPEIVLTQNPERNWERIFASHPDHMAAGETTIRAVYPDARNPHAYPELLGEGHEAHTVQQIWVTGHPEANLLVDITEVFDLKYRALRCHESQVGHRDDLEEMIRSWAATTATNFGQPEGVLAEAFRVIQSA